jgi:hypothetical protein
MKPTKSNYFLPCWNCKKLAVRQSMDDLTSLENSCKSLPGKSIRCWRKRENSDNKV